MKSILNGVALGTAHRAKAHNPAMLVSEQGVEQEIHVAAGCLLVEMHVTNWTEAQREDPMFSTVLGWLEAQKKTDLKVLLAEHTSSEEGNLILHNQQNFTIHQVALYLHSMPKGKTEDLLLFVVPKAHCVATLNGCHQDAGHQGCDQTSSLLWEHFWWPGMASQVQKSLKSCTCCLQHEGKLSKVPLLLIVSTAPLVLLHVAFVSIGTTTEPNRLPKA